MTIRIEGYLTEENLGKALDEIFGKVDGNVRVPESRYRWDFVVRTGNRTITVEYDDQNHYQDPLKTIRYDKAKDDIAVKLGYEIVRIPYFVQLTTQMMKTYFGVDCEIEQSYPHGFIDTRHLPASFCELGIERFKDELKNLPENVRRDISESLKKKAAEYGTMYTVPSSLMYLLE